KEAHQVRRPPQSTRSARHASQNHLPKRLPRNGSKRIFARKRPGTSTSPLRVSAGGKPYCADAMISPGIAPRTLVSSVILVKYTAVARYPAFRDWPLLADSESLHGSC